MCEVGNWNVAVCGPCVWARGCHGSSALDATRQARTVGPTWNPSRLSSMHLPMSPLDRTIGGDVSVNLSNRSILQGRRLGKIGVGAWQARGPSARLTCL